MKWIKAISSGLVGIIGAVAVYELAVLWGVAPFNIAPLAAFMLRLGMEVGAAAFFVHLIYGMLWALVLVWIFDTNLSILKGLGLSVFLWLINGFVYAPYIGWGVFGFTGTPELAEAHQLYLRPGPWLASITLIYYLVYGAIVGWVTSNWIKSEADVAGQIRMHRED